MIKAIVKPVYNAMHDLLYATSGINPFFKHTHNNKPVVKGFVGDDHLADPTLDDVLEKQLLHANIPVSHFHININGYKDYLQKANYPSDYYGGQPGQNNFTEKTLEHFVGTCFIPFTRDMVFMDVAACTSPFSSIAQKVFGVQKVYQQDLIYPKGINGNKIGGYAHETTLPSNSVDAITLHCSLEHFEGDTDKLFFAEVNRILKTGGKAVILPFYFAHTYTIHIDPAFNLLRNHHPIIDAEADLHYCNWYQYHSRHYDVMQVQKRIASQMPDCSIKLFRVDNFREVWDKSYLRWILEITKN
ncbi:MAG TPA: methyltransferase domain-containing protein [Bacteroidia bacterium]|nr:methyltransferase domain-containing protein [Bacteroidia bacterium]